MAQIHVVITEDNVDRGIGMLFSHALEHIHRGRLCFDIHKLACIQYIAWL